MYCMVSSNLLIKREVMWIPYDMCVLFSPTFLPVISLSPLTAVSLHSRRVFWAAIYHL